MVAKSKDNVRRCAWNILGLLTTVILLFVSGRQAATAGACAAPPQPAGQSAPDESIPTEPLLEAWVCGAQELAELPNKHRVGVLNAIGLGDAVLPHLEGLDQLRSLTLAYGNDELTDAGLVHVARLRTLRDLSLEQTSVTDKGIQLLKPLDRLLRLHLAATPVTGDGLEGFSSLRELDLSRTHLNSEGLKRVGALKGLRILDVSDTPLSDAGLEKLAGLTELVELRLEGTQITGAGLRHLGGMSKMRRLRLWGCTVDDASLAALVRLDHLQELDLSDTQVTDAGLQHLRKLKHLKRVWLIRCKVTPWGEAGLREALPGLEINPDEAMGQIQELTIRPTRNVNHRA